MVPGKFLAGPYVYLSMIMGPGLTAVIRSSGGFQVFRLNILEP